MDRANVYDVQPQMWTFEGADGHRAFVILQGNAETLKHSSIRTFILRGIAWAAKARECGRAFQRGGSRDAAVSRGRRAAREDTVKSFEMMPGFAATAIASEPLINKPIAMQFDAKAGCGSRRRRSIRTAAVLPSSPRGRKPAC